MYLKLADIKSLEDTATLESTGVEGEIDRDIERTFPANAFYTKHGDGKRQLGNVLKAITSYAHDVGYCQGMNYVVAALLLLMKDSQDAMALYLEEFSMQEAAFWLTLALIRHRGMAELWKPKMPGTRLLAEEINVIDVSRLSQCIYLLQQLLKLHFYDLSAHFRHIGLHSSILVTQWFVTVFARVLTPSSLVRVWDLVFMDGWKAVYQVALAIIAELRPTLLTMDLEQCSEFFRQNPRLGLEKKIPSPAVLLQRALSFKVTRSSLKQLEEERHLEYLRLRLQETPLSDEHRILFPSLGYEGDVAAKKKALQLIRQKLQHYDTDVASDTIVLQGKIEAAEKAQATAMSIRYALAYALSEATIELNERLEIQTRLRFKFHKLMATAITEATTSTSASACASGFTIWSHPFEFINERMTSCLERLPLLASFLESGNESQNDALDIDEFETQRNLKHLEMLVPRLAAELRVLQQSLAYNERALRPLQLRTRQLHGEAQLARFEVEETQLFKDKLADQLLQIMLTSEKLKNERMQQLFAEVDTNEKIST
ncbi:hypothetical protein CCR75_002148 [Bremia lactucae]|uniref:Rab-GAP TBC domain-containing protein n=1 Tax=Bremia lactucae TaxID=4779 RepID=A0A976ICI7_BRELC|nr:hypothetical protein CCR75_002148 [Bremia lactucae]